MSQARERLRRVLPQPTCTVAANIFDPLSARIASMLDYDVCFLSGSVGKVANLGVPDLVLYNLSDGRGPLPSHYPPGRRELDGGWRGRFRQRRGAAQLPLPIGRVGPVAHHLPDVPEDRGSTAKRRPYVTAISRTHMACRKASTKARVYCLQA